MIPEFYSRDEHGIPRAWVARMRESMARLTPAFSTNRAVRQYTDEYYVPAAEGFRRRAEKRGSLGTDLLNWQSDLEKHWRLLRFGSATVGKEAEQYVFQVQVFLDDLDPDAVKAELYAEGPNSDAPVTQPLIRGEHLVGSSNGFTYTARVPASRPAADYTPRLVPAHSGAHVPLESSFILWHDSPSWR